MRIFAFDPVPLALLPSNREQGYVHIKNGVTTEFLDAMRRFVADSFSSHEVKGTRWLMRGGREYAARRNASSQLVRTHRAQSYQRVWRDAAMDLGAEPRVIGREILRGGAVPRGGLT